MIKIELWFPIPSLFPQMTALVLCRNFLSSFRPPLPSPFPPFSYVQKLMCHVALVKPIYLFGDNLELMKLGIGCFLHFFPKYE